jgi:hypothetical protein
MGPFPLKTKRDDLSGCPMDTFILLLKPSDKVSVGCGAADKPIAPPEPFPDKIIRPLNLSSLM